MMKKRYSKPLKITTSLMCTAFLFACSNTNDVENIDVSSGTLAAAESLRTIGNQEITAVISEKVNYSEEDYFTEWDNPTTIQLSRGSASFDGAGGVVIEDQVINIRTSGVYVISGKLDDGQIVVNAEDKGIVRLVLNGAEINASSTFTRFHQ
jgi:hypothetical protein